MCWHCISSHANSSHLQWRCQGHFFANTTMMHQFWCRDQPVSLHHCYLQLFAQTCTRWLQKLLHRHHHLPFIPTKLIYGVSRGRWRLWREVLYKRMQSFFLWSNPTGGTLAPIGVNQCPQIPPYPMSFGTRWNLSCHSESSLRSCKTWELFFQRLSHSNLWGILRMIYKHFSSTLLFRCSFTMQLNSTTWRFGCVWISAPQQMLTAGTVCKLCSSLLNMHYWES